MTTLRQRMTEDLRVRNDAPRTVKTYVSHVRRFAEHFGRSPADLGHEEIRQYQLHLVEEQRASGSTFNQVVSALRFLYSVTLKREGAIAQIPHARREKKLPVVLSVKEVRGLLRAVQNLKHRTALMTIYGGGLRLSEGIGLEVSDIDSKRMVLRVRQAKGHKDRFVPLSLDAREDLQGSAREKWPTPMPLEGRRDR
jgi:site-specific recombinase XerD